MLVFPKLLDPQYLHFVVATRSLHDYLNIILKQFVMS
jgi:hypothetical protein